MRTLDGSPLTYEKKKFIKETVIGGLIFGLAWVITGACLGPIFVEIGIFGWFCDFIVYCVSYPDLWSGEGTVTSLI